MSSFCGGRVGWQFDVLVNHTACRLRVCLFGFLCVSGQKRLRRRSRGAHHVAATSHYIFASSNNIAAVVVLWFYRVVSVWGYIGWQFEVPRIDTACGFRVCFILSGRKHLGLQSRGGAWRVLTRRRRRNTTKQQQADRRGKRGDVVIEQ